MYVRACMCVWVCACVWGGGCLCVCVCVCECVCVCARAHAYICGYIHNKPAETNYKINDKEKKEKRKDGQCVNKTFQAFFNRSK